MKRYLVAGLFIFAVSCMTTTMAPYFDDVAAKKFTPAAGKARVYVSRPGSQGAAGLTEVVIDGRMIGQLSVKTYVFVDLEPGAHSVTWQGVHPFTVNAGDVAFFRIQNFGKFRRDTDEDGRAAVSGCRLAQAIP